MNETEPICRVCEIELTDDNWSPSLRNMNSRICKKCNSKKSCLWAVANPEKVKLSSTARNRRNGHLPMSENKKCPLHLGVHIAERLVRHYFDHVIVMPNNNHGYDFICNRDKLIDVKSSCLNKNGHWVFMIRHNTTADFFLCIGFDSMESLNVLHVWLIPGKVVNHLAGTGISPSTIHRWDQYKLDIDKVSLCCNEMKDIARGD